MASVGSVTRSTIPTLSLQKPAGDNRYYYGLAGNDDFMGI